MKKNLANGIKLLQSILEMGEKRMPTEIARNDFSARGETLLNILSETSESLLDLTLKLREEADLVDVHSVAFRVLSETADRLEEIRSEWRIVKVDPNSTNRVYKEFKDGGDR